MTLFTIVVTLLALLSLTGDIAFALTVPPHPSRSKDVHTDWVPISIDVESALNIRNIELHRRRRNDFSSDHVPLHLSFFGYDREFILELEVNDQLISPNSMFYAANGEKLDIDLNRFHRGHVVGESNSRVRIFIDDEESYAFGIIHMPLEKTIYTIDLATNVKLHEEPPAGTKMVLLRTRDETDGSALAKPMNINTSSPIGRRNDASSSSREKRENNPSLCSLYLDIDSSFIDFWGGRGIPETQRNRRAFEAAISIINEVNGIYEENFGVFQLHIVGIEAVAESFVGAIVSGDDVIIYYEQWLPYKLRKGLQFDEVCLNHLFVHRECHGIIGVAHQLFEGSGGICSTTTGTDGHSISATNAGFTTTMDRGQFRDVLNTAVTSAHEIAHNFGAFHDCCGEFEEDDPMPPTPENCKRMSFCHKGCPVEIYGDRYCDKMASQNHPCVVGPNPTDHFMMYPSSSSSSVHNALIGVGNGLSFSICSKYDIVETLQYAGHCLLNSVPPNPCSGCTDRALCPCCSNGMLLPADTLCRQQGSECVEKETFCDGKNMYCPMPTYKPDGISCTYPIGNLKGICLRGECGTPHSNFCATISDTFYFSCMVPNYQCIKTCLIPVGGQYSCSILSHSCPAPNMLNLMTECPYSDIMTPCIVEGGSDGFCDGVGGCRLFQDL